MISYKSANEYFKERFGKKTYRLALFGGETCPVRDGSLCLGGCSFCAEGSAYFSAAGADIHSEIENAKRFVAGKSGADCAYIAYFQSFTSTYMPLKRMRELFFQAALRDDISAISVGTRADCLPEPVIKLLEELNNVKPVFVELGLQTSREDTARLINRRFTLRTFDDAVERLTRCGIEVITHVIVGLPGETAEDVLNTALHAYSVGSRGIKLQLLHILKGTRFAELYEQGEITCLTLEEYADIIKYVLSALPSDMVVHRLTGDGAKNLLIAPKWSADKKCVLNTLSSLLKNAD